MELKWMLSKVLDQPTGETSYAMPKAPSYENRSSECPPAPGIEKREGVHLLFQVQIRDYQVENELVSALTLVLLHRS